MIPGVRHQCPCGDHACCVERAALIKRLGDMEAHVADEVRERTQTLQRERDEALAALRAVKERTQGASHHMGTDIAHIVGQALGGGAT